MIKRQKAHKNKNYHRMSKGCHRMSRFRAIVGAILEWVEKQASLVNCRTLKHLCNLHWRSSTGTFRCWSQRSSISKAVWMAGWTIWWNWISLLRGLLKK